MVEREGGTPFVEQMREDARARVNNWLARQATRLQTTSEVILDAVRRGWLPAQIEAVESKYALEGVALCAEIREGIERIRRAPILPVPMNERAMHVLRRSGSHRSEQGGTAMESAFDKARA